MGLVFHNGKFIPEQHIQKSIEEARVLRLLRSFLDAKEPELVRLLVTTWRTQGKAITYKELREAIIAGEISIEMWEDWQQDYSRFVTQYMLPAWQEAIDAAARAREQMLSGWYFNPMAEGLREWVETHAAAFVTNITQTQIAGLRAVIHQAAALEVKNVDQLARVIRPMVGLTKQQAKANLKYYNTLIANGTSEKRALDLSIKYASRQSRERAYTVARTEMAYAYNKGADNAVRQAQAAGYMGKTKKVWCTADDERTCKICAALEGKVIAMDDDFDFSTKLAATNPEIRRTPPAHPGCRCGVMYEEE